MADGYTTFASSGPGRAIAKRLGLPTPVRLRRGPEPIGPVLLGGNGQLLDAIRSALPVPTVDAPETGLGALVYDASGITDSARLVELYEFFHPVARSLAPSGRVIVFGDLEPAGPREATAQRALEGFVRSMGKEIGRGSTAQLVYASAGAGLDSTLRFLLSGRSAYVSGQVIRISGPASPAADPALDGKVALVTGAARGIGEAIATVLARDGAHVICLDLPSAGDSLATVANRLKGEALQLDLTAASAPRALADYLKRRHDGVDIVVHNAGITRDKTIARMTDAHWTAVLEVNLSAQERVNDVLIEEKVIRDGGRLIGVSSIAGIAGNRGQTNYATSKAGVIGLVQALSPVLAERGITVNAVAPGFIETAMTAKMPLVLREVSRRMNSLSQGGLPVDVAETIAWFADPGSAGVTGNVVRVCGQMLVGA